jgi:two-component system, chemotaxis family, sensor kinase CheA
MTIDISRFHKTFFEESFEGLDSMESALLKLDVGAADAETINTIFRAAHSIKGGAGTFGFSAIAEFTHAVETLLDEMRSGRRAVSQPGVDLLLQSVDGMRNLLTAARDGVAADVQAIAGIRADLDRMLKDTASPPAAAPARPEPPAPAPAPPAVAAGVWRIRFVPKPELFRSGNDPLRILRELAALGELKLECDTSRLPALIDAVAEDCYLAWSGELSTTADRSQIEDVFAWVTEECKLEITPPAVAPAEKAPAPPDPAPPAAADKPALKIIEGGKPAAEDRRADGSSIRVSTDKIDALINLVGELVITQAMLTQQASQLDPVANEKLLNGLSQLDRNTRRLQEAVMSTRMLPMDFVFSRFPRVVRDLAGKLGKQVRLVTAGESTELDKSVIERIADPLNHLVRNSLDHGLETPPERLAAGKDATGTIQLRASHQGGHIVIEIADDGRGLNRQKLLAKAQERGLPCADSMSDSDVWNLIFAPGFSTAAAITDVSGRGVGMDVVKKNILALGGQVELSSVAGRGMTVTIRLPLTLAILDGMSVRIGEEIFIVPLNSVIESLQPAPEQVKAVAAQGSVVRVRNEYLPLVPLHQVFRLPAQHTEAHRGIVVLLESEGRKIAALVDELVGQQQVVIKSLEANYRRVRGVSGATILGDGRVALILDVGGLVRDLHQAAAA